MSEPRKEAATIVLLPGMDGTGALFADFASALGTKVVVASYPVDRALGYAELEESVRRVLPANEPFILLGESFSGPIAISLASSRPPGLRALVLVCSFAKLPARFRSLRAAAMLPFWRMPAWLIAEVMLGRFGTESARARLYDAMQKVAPAVWRSRLDSMFEADARAKLAEVEVPILYLRATRDRAMPTSASRTISKTVPGARIVEMEGPHLLLQCKSEQAAAAVRRFAADCGIAL